VKVKDVMLKWNAVVPFPWTPAKLREAGLDPSSTLRAIMDDIFLADDYKESPTAQKIITTLTLPFEPD